MLHGGPTNQRRKAEAGKAFAKTSMRVPVVDVAGWIGENFKDEDLVVLKMDAEGAEFGIMRKLIREQHMPLVDVLLMECHSWAKFTDPTHDCKTLLKEIPRAGHKDLKIYLENVGKSSHSRIHDEVLGRGYDSASTPQMRMPIDPRKAAPARCSSSTLYATSTTGFEAGVGVGYRR